MRINEVYKPNVWYIAIVNDTQIAIAFMGFIHQFIL